MIFDLRTVKRAFAGQFRPLDAVFAQRVAQSVFRAVPRRIVAQPLVGSQRDLDHDVGEAEVAVDGERQLVERDALALDLLFRAEDVAVILRECAHAHDPVQRAGGLVAMARAEFAVAQRQVAVAPHVRVEDQHVAGTVHRLHREVALLGLRREHVFLEILPVAGALP